MNRSALSFIVGAGLVGAAASATSASVTFTFNDLSGNFASSGGGNGNFSASAVDAGLLHSNGTVARNDAPTGNANFGPGFVSLPDSGNFSLSLSVVNTGPTTANGSGTFTITDATGDTLSGVLSGTWTVATVPQPGVRFNGLISSASFSSAGSFDGSTSGSFSMAGYGILTGALVELTLGPTSFFNSSFSDMVTGVNATLVPTPGALALLGLAGAAAGRRRR